MESTEITQLAAQYVNNTNRSIFLTGKAGTGKTTFLKNIVENTYKNTIVAAPTGIAAINAKGVTLHSLFQLPFGTFIPENIAFQDSYSQMNTPQSVVSKLQMHKTKRNMLREMELLIIDEVSMLRADLLDCIDTVLRHVRRKRNEPFGGVQMLFIGDLMQLPPVVKDSEWRYISKYYKSAFFFEALALQNQPPINIELDKVYRQSNADFIGILNHLRNNELTNEDITVLNSHCNTNFDPKSEEGYIHITTHNRIADQVNKQELDKLSTKAQEIKAVVKGDFDERIYPIEETMVLKEDAQVMFIKNDPSGERRFFNGKIGKITKINREDKLVTVTCADDGERIVLEPYVWENKRYKLNETTNIIEEIVKGTFEHFPIRLAWAITVHKSQGLTFKKAVMDLSQCFAPGQMYVALSRMTSLDGLVLSKPIVPLDFNVDNAIVDFISRKKDVKTLHETIVHDAREFHGHYVHRTFDFETLIRNLGYHVGSYSKEANRSSKQKHQVWARELLEKSKPLKEIGDKFCAQTKKIMAETSYLETLNNRVTKAKDYFDPEFKSLIAEVDKHIKFVKDAKGIKTYLKELGEVRNEFHHRILEMSKLQLLLDAALNKEDFTKAKLQSSGAYKEQLATLPSGKRKKTKEAKIDTKQASLTLFQEGLSLDEIAERRNLVRTTIEGHLAHFVKDGVIPVDRLISAEKLDNILTVIKTIDSTLSSAVKEKLGDEYTYSEIKIALAHHAFTNPVLDP